MYAGVEKENFQRSAKSEADGEHFYRGRSLQWIAVSPLLLRVAIISVNTQHGRRRHASGKEKGRVCSTSNGPWAEGKGKCTVLRH